MRITIKKYYGLIAATVLLLVCTLGLVASRGAFEPSIVLRGYAPLAVFLIVIALVALIAQLLTHTLRVEASLASNNAEINHILASANEGLFLINKDFEIGRQKSARVKEIFGDGVDVSGNFFHLLHHVSPQTEIKLAREYVELLMAGRVKQQLMRDINPMQEVPIEVTQPNGGTVQKFLHIDFTRDESEHIDPKQPRALVSITDITREIQLRGELEQTKEQQQERLDLLLSVVNVNADELDAFFNETKENLVEINSVLAQEGAEHQDNVEKLASIATMVHRLKGDASALGLDFFESAFDHFEESVSLVKRNMYIDGRDMMALTVQLKEIINEVEMVKTITPQLRSVGTSQLKAVETEISSIPDRLLQVAQRAAENAGKHVDLSCTGFEVLADRPELARKMDAMAIQLVRNAVVHGIEAPVDRLDQNKSPLAMIRVNLAKEEARYKMSVLDDGRGLDFDRIRAKVAAQLGMDEKQAEKLDRGKLLHYIFQPGFTSLDEATVDGGRGVGLSLVRDEANNLGGRIAVKSSPGKYCQFAVTIPLAKES